MIKLQKGSESRRCFLSKNNITFKNQIFQLKRVQFKDLFLQRKLYIKNCHKVIILVLKIRVQIMVHVHLNFGKNYIQ